MLTFKHSVNFVTEIDPKTAPDNIMSAISTMSEETLNKVLVGAFIDALKDHKFLEKLNKNNTYATLKVGNNQ